MSKNRKNRSVSKETDTSAKQTKGSVTRAKKSLHIAEDWVK